MTSTINERCDNKVYSKMECRILQDGNVCYKMYQKFDAEVKANNATKERELAARQRQERVERNALAQEQEKVAQKEARELEQMFRDKERELQLKEREQALQETKDVTPKPKSTSGSGMLICRDGSLSPTCQCGGPRRGCCSHHKGVAGCDR
jgi:hypothetical protein